MTEVAMRKLPGIVVAVSLLAFAAGCSSSTAKQPNRGGGFRTLEAVVVERGTETASNGALSYYMGFEAKDGEATVHMRYPVTHDQYLRYPEGTHVKLVLSDNDLREIRKDTGN